MGGKPALDHYKDGLFDGAAKTIWHRGQPAEVLWASGMGHRGGYAYRLCKVNDGKVWEVTEQCFQNGHLNFYGGTTWIYFNPYPKILILKIGLHNPSKLLLLAPLLLVQSGLK